MTRCGGRWSSPCPTARRPGCTRTGGPMLVDGAAGARVRGRRTRWSSPDGEPVEAALRDGVVAAYDVIVTTGGTGSTPPDRTPEMTRRVLDREVPGHRRGDPSVRRARRCRRRCCRGAWPASPGARWWSTCRDRPAGAATGWPCCEPVLAHAVDQIARRRPLEHRGTGRLRLQPRARWGCARPASVTRRAWREVGSAQPATGSAAGRRPPPEPSGRIAVAFPAMVRYICAARPTRAECCRSSSTYEGRLVGQLTVGGITWGSMLLGACRLLGGPAVAGRGVMPTARRAGRRPLLPYGRTAPHRGQHPAGERRRAGGSWRSSDSATRGCGRGCCTSTVPGATIWSSRSPPKRSARRSHRPLARASRPPPARNR